MAGVCARRGPAGCSLGTNIAREQKCPGLRAVGSKRGLRPAKFPSGQHGAHNRINFRLLSSVEVKRGGRERERKRKEEGERHSG